MKKNKQLFWVASFLFFFSSAGAFAKKSMFFANKIPDYSQTQINEEIHNYGKAYCAPTAASNVLRWLHAERVNQGKLIKLLASKEYMNTDPMRGTRFVSFISGIAEYMDDHLDGYKSLKYQGIGYVEPQYDTGIYAPDIEWITDGLGIKKATWLRLGYYDYDPEKKEYTRQEGHIVNLVGYNLSPRNNILVIHDPATQPDDTIINNYLDVHILEEGVINYGGKTSIPAKDQLLVLNGKEMYPKADAVIIEGAVRLETN